MPTGSAATRSPGRPGASLKLRGPPRTTFACGVLSSAAGPGGSKRKAASEPSRLIARTTTGSTSGHRAARSRRRPRPGATTTERVANGKRSVRSRTAARNYRRAPKRDGLRWGARPPLRGSLHCGRRGGQGRSRSRSRIARAAGATAARFAVVRTAVDGSFVYLLAPGQPRVMSTVSYREFAGEASASASAHLDVLVTPADHAAQSRRHAPHPIKRPHNQTFSGRVAGLAMSRAAACRSRSSTAKGAGG